MKYFRFIIGPILGTERYINHWQYDLLLRRIILKHNSTQIISYNIVASGCSTVVEHSTHFPKVEGSFPAEKWEWNWREEKVKKLQYLIYDNNFRIDYRYSLLSRHSLLTLNQSTCASLLIRHSVYPTQASLLGFLINFVNNFHFNFVVMYVYFENDLKE